MDIKISRELHEGTNAVIRADLPLGHRESLRLDLPGPDNAPGSPGRRADHPGRHHHPRGPRPALQHLPRPRAGGPSQHHPRVRRPVLRPRAGGQRGLPLPQPGPDLRRPADLRAQLRRGGPHRLPRQRLARRHRRRRAPRRPLRARLQRQPGPRRDRLPERRPRPRPPRPAAGAPPGQHHLLQPPSGARRPRPARERRQARDQGPLPLRAQLRPLVGKSVPVFKDLRLAVNRPGKNNDLADAASQFVRRSATPPTRRSSRRSRR